jgi:hypothetical protein
LRKIQSAHKERKEFLVVLEKFGVAVLGDFIAPLRSYRD